MEESEKRRERLKAMRLEAAQATVSCNTGESLGASPGLSNPLVESSSSQSMQANAHSAPRFDYYTDPMSAFSANKRRSHQVRPNIYTNPRPRSDMPPAPTSGANNTYSPEQRPFPAQGAYQCSPLGGPMRGAVPFGSPQVNSPGFFGGSNNCPPHQMMPLTPGAYQNSPQAGPMQTASPFGTPHMHSPAGFSGPTSPSSFIPPNLSRGGSSPSSHFTQHGGQANFVQGRGQGFNYNPGPPPGRGGSYHPNTGRGRSNRTSPGRGRGSPGPPPGRGGSYHPHTGSGQGRYDSSHNSPSGEFRPEQYYSRSMTEDPWQHLKPVIWRRQNISTPGPPSSWLPKSIQTKRARVAEDSKKPTSGPSLAEYLASAFNEAVDPEDADGS